MKKQSLLGALLVLGCLVALGAAKMTADTNTGVWSIEGMNVHSFVEKGAQVFDSGISHDRAILVNPEIIGDRVYFTPEMMDRYGKLPSENGRPFFYRDQLSRPDRVYRIKPEAKVYVLLKEPVTGKNGLTHIMPDEAEHAFMAEGSDSYLVDPKVIINHESPKVFLDWLHGSEAEWNYDPANPPAAARFIPRDQLELLN
jgi:hypothetical protein